MSKDYRLMRGSQVDIGGLAVQIPQDRPKTQDEVMALEEQIAYIERQVAPHKAIVDVSKIVKDGLREDITAGVSAMLFASAPVDPESVPLFRETVLSDPELSGSPAPLQLTEGTDDQPKRRRGRKTGS